MQPFRKVVCVGAGPKSLAVALLVTVLRRLQAADIELLIVEKDSVGANWFGGAGYTDDGSNDAGNGGAGGNGTGTTAGGGNGGATGPPSKHHRRGHRYQDPSGE